ncbi:hypothetical protein [Novosphingopyxis baekryungensis]|uniref:hypothetical protein n=1 Tax=Novosphingopyxis baekryungensis TaxID=279369 RepID=UPI0003B50EAC|nr:hypothetical protein [Novosphingopyxis baekryungensis]
MAVFIASGQLGIHDPRFARWPREAFTAYYEIYLSGGERDERRAIRETFNGREADYTGHEVVFYVNRDYDIEKMRTNVSGLLSDDMEVTVIRSSKRQWDWKKNQKKS